MAKYAAFGTVLTIGGATVVQVRDISGPSLALDTEDVTTHDSTGGWEEHVGTILRSGEVSFEIEYDPVAATHAALLTTMTSRTAAACTIVMPDAGATTFSFSAFVTGFEPGMPHDGALTASVTLKPTGAVTTA